MPPADRATRHPELCTGGSMRRTSGRVCTHRRHPPPHGGLPGAVAAVFCRDYPPDGAGRALRHQWASKGIVCIVRPILRRCALFLRGCMGRRISSYFTTVSATLPASVCWSDP